MVCLQRLIELVVCTDRSGKKPHRHVKGGDISELQWCNGQHIGSDTRDVGSILILEIQDFPFSPPPAMMLVAVIGILYKLHAVWLTNLPSMVIACMHEIINI